MKDQHIDGMIRALRSQIKDRHKAKALLQNYWTERIAVVWTIEQVHQAANEQKTVLTRDEARQILHKLDQQSDTFVVFDWFGLKECINDSGLGRNITTNELNQFVNKNVIAKAK